MRSFIKIEKEFINFLISSNRRQRNIVSFLDKHLERTTIKLYFKERKAEFWFEYGKPDDFGTGWIINKIEDLQELIATVINLIVYLKNDGYIIPYSVTPDKWSEVHEFGRGVEEELKLPSPFPDKEIEKLILEYAFKEIIPLEPLDDLVRNNYISQEERRFNKQHTVAWVGIFVAMAIGLSGIAYNFVSLIKQEASTNIQHNKILESIELLTEQLSTANEIEENKSHKIERLANTLEAISESGSTHLIDIDSNLQKINKSINKLIDKKYNKQIQPTQKPRG